ncbi:MAG: hypothetical protein ISQ32_05615, partial [Rickettsiales bacterium]|nr:hypothetical protein [Rickettsiales bacterium]
LIEELKSKNQSLDATIVSLEKDNARILEDSTKTSKDNLKEIENKKTQIKKLTVETTLTYNQIKSLEDEKVDLTSKLEASTKANHENTSKISELTESTRILNEKVIAAANEISSLQSEKADIIDQNKGLSKAVEESINTSELLSKKYQEISLDQEEKTQKSVLEINKLKEDLKFAKIRNNHHMSGESIYKNLISNNSTFNSSLSQFRDRVIGSVIDISGKENSSFSQKYYPQFFDLDYSISGNLSDYPIFKTLQESLVFLDKEQISEDNINDLNARVKQIIQGFDSVKKSAIVRHYKKASENLNVFLLNNYKDFEFKSIKESVDIVRNIKLLVTNTIKDLHYQKEKLFDKCLSQFETILAKDISGLNHEGVLSIVYFTDKEKEYIVAKHADNNLPSISGSTPKINKYFESKIRKGFNDFIKAIVRSEHQIEREIDGFEFLIRRLDTSESLNEKQLKNKEIYKSKIDKLNEKKNKLITIRSEVFISDGTDNFQEIKKASNFIKGLSVMIDLNFEYFRAYDLAEKLKSYVNSKRYLPFGLEELSNCFYFISKLRRVGSNLIDDIQQQFPTIENSDVKTSVEYSVRAHQKTDSDTKNTLLSRFHDKNYYEKRFIQKKFIDNIESKCLDTQKFCFNQFNVFEFLASQLYFDPNCKRLDLNIDVITNDVNKLNKYQEALKFINSFNLKAFNLESLGLLDDITPPQSRTQSSAVQLIDPDDHEIHNDVNIASADNAITVENLKLHMRKDAEVSNKSYVASLDSNNSVVASIGDGSFMHDI